MAKLDPDQIYSLLLDGGFSPGQARIMTAIAQAESAGRVDAVGDVGLQTSKWGPSVGLFQVRTLKSETGTGSDRDIEHLTNNPAAQVKAALHISGGGDRYGPWSTYTHGTYRRYLGEELHQVPVSGIGTGGGTVSLESTHPPGDSFAIDTGARPTAILDTDHDGLTDDFEKLLGTDAHSADSDQDGLSDAYETAVSHTDALPADTDHDGVPDAQEVAAGTSPGRADVPDAARAAGFGGLDTLDSDHDGLSDGYEKGIGSDPFATDSDHDGLLDSSEVAHGTSPTSIDSNHDGLTDAFNAGEDLLDDPAGH